MRLTQESGGDGRRIANEDIGSKGHQLFCEAFGLIGARRRKAIVDQDAAAFDPAKVI
jgi:hypothetical protein